MKHDISIVNKELITILYEKIKNFDWPHISKKINIPFPDPIDIRNIRHFIDLWIYQIENNSILLEVNKNQLIYLYKFINETDKILKKFLIALEECFHQQELFNVLSNIQEFREYEFQGPLDKEKLFIPLYALLKINIDNKFTLNTDIIWVSTYNCEWEVYDWVDCEIYNYRPDLFIIMHLNIINICSSKTIAKYDEFLVMNKEFINKSFVFQWDLETYMSSLKDKIILDISITIYDRIIKNNQKIILRLTKSEYKIIKDLKSHIDKWWMSVDNLRKSTNQTDAALKQMIKRINSNIRSIGYSEYIKVEYNKQSKSYFLIINNSKKNNI